MENSKRMRKKKRITINSRDFFFKKSLNQVDNPAERVKSGEEKLLKIMILPGKCMTFKHITLRLKSISGCSRKLMLSCHIWKTEWRLEKECPIHNVNPYRRTVPKQGDLEHS
jgi:hypothetical protein